MSSEWPLVKVGEISDTISDTHKKDKERLIFLNTSDILNGKLLHETYSPVSTWPGQAKKSIRRNDILFSEIRPANGRWAFVAVDADDYVVSTKLMVIRPRADAVRPRYLYHFLTSSSTTRWLQYLAESRSGTFPQITFDQVAELEISLPPLPEQERIAEFLDALDDKIELNRRMNETLEAMARALFESWFVDFGPVRSKAENRDTGLPKHLAELLPDSFEPSSIGDIPSGWRLGRLADVAESSRRGATPREIPSETPYIGLEHMPRRSITLSEWGDSGGLESNKFRFERGEILFGKLRPYFHKVGVAPVDGVCSTDIVVVRPKASHWFGFVLGHTSSHAFVEYTNAGSTGTKMPRTSWNEMSRYPVMLPDDHVAEEYTRFVDPAIERILANVHESRTLAFTRDTLLPKLISGELRVRDAARFVSEATT